MTANVFHRAVAFGPFRETLPPDVDGALVVNGEVRDAGQAAVDIADRVAAIRRVLAAVDESLRPGDKIITGLIVQVPVGSGDHVVADLGALGSVRLTIA